MKRGIIVLNHFPVYPPITGGKARIYYLMKNLSNYYSVEVISFENYAKKERKKIKINRPYKINLSTNFRETVVVDSLVNFLFKFTFCWRLNLLNEEVYISLKNPLKKNKNILNRLKKRHFLFLEHPFLSTILDKRILRTAGGIIYDAHNVEFLLKKQVIRRFKKFQLSIVYKVEKYACEVSDLILTTSKEDKEAFIEIYNISEEKLMVVPNGIDCKSLSINIDKRSAKKYFGIDSDKPVAIFIGSGHPPNVEAANYIVNYLAPKLKNIVFIIVGGVCDSINKRLLPSNVILLGILDSKIKNIALKASDIALNPVIFGSGTNIKMLEYMAVGIPTITTSVGARGLDVKNWKHLIISKRPNFSEIIKILVEDTQTLKNIGKNAKKLVRKKYDWGVIARRLIQILQKL